MAKSECKCEHFSCESMIKKAGNFDYVSDTEKRFRFVKNENGSITSEATIDGVLYKSGATPNSIENCEMRPRVNYEDQFGKHGDIQIKPAKS